MCDFQHYVNALESWKSDADTGQVALIGVHSWLDWHRLEYARYVPSGFVKNLTCKINISLGGFAGNRRERRMESPEFAREERVFGGEEERNGEEDLVRPNKMTRPTETIRRNFLRII
ncbi:hypothetical protein YC2023_002403 [Brassica napus]